MPWFWQGWTNQHLVQSESESLLPWGAHLLRACLCLTRLGSTEKNRCCCHCGMVVMLLPPTLEYTARSWRLKFSSLFNPIGFKPIPPTKMLYQPVGYSGWEHFPAFLLKLFHCAKKNSGFTKEKGHNSAAFWLEHSPRWGEPRVLVSARRTAHVFYHLKKKFWSKVWKPGLALQDCSKYTTPGDDMSG